MIQMLSPFTLWKHRYIKEAVYSLKSTSMTWSADFTISFPGIGTHINRILSPLGECSAHVCSYSQSQIFLWHSLFHQVPVYTAEAHMEWETCPRFLYMTLPGIESLSLDQECRTLTTFGAVVWPSYKEASICA